MAQSLRHLAALRVEQSDFAGAETLLRQALAIERRRLGDSVEVAGTLNQLGQTLTQKGDFRGASPSIAKRSPSPARARAVAELLNDLAESRHGQGDLQGAETLYRQALSGLRKRDIERRQRGAR